MKLYLIERRFAEQLGDFTGDDVTELEGINADEGVQWLFSFLTADRMRTYCLYEAPSPDELRAAAERANLPANVIVEVSRVSADGIRAAAPG
jgi:Nickel responsive protein SCO4226-like